MAKKKSVKQSAVVDLTAIADSLLGGLEAEARSEKKRQEKIAEDAKKHRADAVAEKAAVQKAAEQERKKEWGRVKFSREDYPYIDLETLVNIRQADEVRAASVKLVEGHPKRVEAEEALEAFFHRNPAVAREFHTREFCVMASVARGRKMPYNIVRHLLAAGLSEFRELDAVEAHKMNEQIARIIKHKNETKNDGEHDPKSCDICQSSPGYKFETTRRVSGKPDETVYFLAKPSKRVSKDKDEPVEVRQARRCFKVLMDWRSEGQARGAELHDFFSDYPVDENLTLKDLAQGQAQSDDPQKWVKCFIPRHSPYRSENKSGRTFENSGFFLVRQFSENGEPLVSFEIMVPFDPKLSGMCFPLKNTVGNTYRFVSGTKVSFDNLEEEGSGKRKWLAVILTHALKCVREKKDEEVNKKDGKSQEAAAEQG